MDALDELKLNYEFQYKAGCKDQQEMPYNVYVPYYNLLIEYQGEQHYHVVTGLFGGRKKFYTRVRHGYIEKDEQEVIPTPLNRLLIGNLASTNLAKQKENFINAYITHYKEQTTNKVLE